MEICECKGELLPVGECLDVKLVTFSCMAVMELTVGVEAAKLCALLRVDEDIMVARVSSGCSFVLICCN